MPANTDHATQRADAHIHLFEKGYQDDSLPARHGVKRDEITCYHHLAKAHSIGKALVIGYAGQPWCKNNNAYLAKIANQHDWIAPTAYIDPLHPPDEKSLNQLAQDGFIGISLYLFDKQQTQALAQWPDRIWSWLTQRSWLVSVNGCSPWWQAWSDVLASHRQLRLLISHLGLPARVSQAPSSAQAAEALKSVLALATYPQTHVKLSGFYALTDPGHDYPHQAAWPYVQQLLDRFGHQRLLWGSDFSPHLDYLSFPQTLDLFKKIPFLDDPTRQCIEGGNLLTLLGNTGN